MSNIRNLKGQAKNVLKLCILGEGGVGKTTLTKRIITGSFDSSTKMTIGVDFALYNTEIFDPFSPEDAEDVEMLNINAQFWDFAGEERFRFMLPRYCKGAVGGVLCYDLSRYSTTRYIEEWYNIWIENAPKNAPLILVGTKADLLESQEQLEQAELSTAKLAEDLHIDEYYLISSKTGKDIHMLLNELLIKGYAFNVKMLDAKKES